MRVIVHLTEGDRWVGIDAVIEMCRINPGIRDPGHAATARAVLASSSSEPPIFKNPTVQCLPTRWLGRRVFLGNLYAAFSN
jgi:hypothetical protein